MKIENEVLPDLYLETVYNYLEETTSKIEFILSGGVRNRGRTKMRNKSKLITSKEITEVLNLLHKDYSDLGMTISIYSKKYQVLLDRLNPYKLYINKHVANQAMNGTIVGNHREGLISVFPFNYSVKGGSYESKNSVRKLIALGVIIHEIRHAYQRKHKVEKYTSEKLNGHGYDTQWVERDANKFTQRFMNRYRNKINEILKINNLNWEYQWDRLRVDEIN